MPLAAVDPLPSCFSDDQGISSEGSSAESSKDTELVGVVAEDVDKVATTSVEDRRDFKRLDKIVRHGISAFKECGRALQEIHDRKLWKPGGHKSSKESFSDPAPASGSGVMPKPWDFGLWNLEERIPDSPPSVRAESRLPVSHACSKRWSP